jgi:dipeptidyl aminopeptidase/acylaminoacyl peptidase
VLYTVSAPDWKEGRRQSDVWIAGTERGAPPARQLTFTKDKNETAPAWSRDGSFFVFASDRDAGPSSGAPGAANANARNQLYLMRPDGGEARRITDAKDGVSTFAFSRDGRWLAYRSGKPGEEQLYLLPAAAPDSARAQPLTRQAAGVGLWRWAPDGRRIYFVTADTADADEKARAEKKFTATVRNAEAPRSSLWALDVASRRADRLTRDTAITVADFTVSDDGRWVGFRGVAADRYKRNITEQFINADLYLLDASTGAIERLTSNREVAEEPLTFSPDSRWAAFSAPDDLTRYTMKNRRVYLRRVGDRGGAWRKLGAGFDGDVGADFWSADGRTIYFNEGVRATTQLLALDVASGAVRPVTRVRGALAVERDGETGRLVLRYEDPKTPPALYAIARPEDAADRGRWRPLGDVNPQARHLLLGDEEEVTWKSADGREVGGILVKPVGWRPGVRYPLIVAIHGGPAAADVLSFNGGYGAQVYAGAGYAVLKPNYRGSTNYGEAHKTGIVGNYFAPGYDDIMTGVDALVARGVADPARMGVLGWSAGGHWSNWILTHTDRFRAISSGAGTANWVSMYAESDVQRNRQYYLGDRLPYDDFDAYWNQSPLKYIRNAKTPTMIHVVDGDPRVPRPQSEELHMALKRLGVPTEFYVYPGSTHGIPDPRNRLVKSTAEMAWMDFYVRGSGRRFAWRDVLRTLEEPAAPGAEAPARTAAAGGAVP